MKKVICIIAMALCLVSCWVEEREEKEAEAKKEYLYLKDNVHLVVNRFEYDGHKYILFFSGEIRNGFVHDPDCPCHVQYINKDKTSDYPDWW